MNRRWWIVLAGLVAMAMGSTSAAAEGWGLSKLIPFQKSSASTSKRARASVSDDKQSSWLPKMSLPSWSSKSKPQPHRSEPSTLSKLNQGTKDFFGKSKDVLMPWSKTPSKKPTARPASAKKQVAKTPWYKSWIPQKKEEKKPLSVSEFIGQERPEF